MMPDSGGDAPAEGVVSGTMRAGCGEGWPAVSTGVGAGCSGTRDRVLTTAGFDVWGLAAGFLGTALTTFFFAADFFAIFFAGRCFFCFFAPFFAPACFTAFFLGAFPLGAFFFAAVFFAVFFLAIGISWRELWAEQGARPA